MRLPAFALLVLALVGLALIGLAPESGLAAATASAWLNSARAASSSLRAPAIRSGRGVVIFGSSAPLKLNTKNIRKTLNRNIASGET